MSNEILNECASAATSWPDVGLAVVFGICACVYFWLAFR